MSKRAKTQKSKARKQKLQAARAAMRAVYESYRDSGQNKKSKRFSLRGKRSALVKNESHTDGLCGNIACYKCNPAEHNMPPHMKLLREIRRPGFKRGITTDAQHASDRLFSPKRHLVVAPISTP